MQISSVLRLTFRHPPAPPEPSVLVERPTPVPFVAYGDDCVVSGATELVGAPRLTDMLNRHDGVDLVSVSVEPLSGESAFPVERLELSRNDILLVAATGPRGETSHRTRTRAHGVTVYVGPYLVRGYLHARPGADPLSHLHRRAPMVPLTDATVEYYVDDQLRRDAASVLIVNRDRVSSLSEAADHTAPRSAQPRTLQSADVRI